MKPSERLSANIVTTHIPVWEDGKVTRYISESTLTGAELASRLAKARRFQARLELCIEAMAEAFDSGETVEEREARIAAEDADPMGYAAGGGWWAIENFARRCDQGPRGFAKHIRDLKGKVVRPINFEHLVGSTWPEYESRGFWWADHFEHAESWSDALAKVRKARVEALHKRYGS